MILCVSQDITWRIILRPMLDLALLRVVDHAIDPKSVIRAGVGTISNDRH